MHHGLQHVLPDENVPAEIAAWDLGAGETSVIAYGVRHRDHEAILDDRAARRCAAVVRVPVTGSLGVLLIAKRRGLLPEVKPWVEKLKRAGAHLNDDLVSKALKMVGEGAGC